jgi:serine/threonine protein phosphatase PrpC
MKFSIFQESREGARKSNQDRVGYCYSRDALLMVVADGMGGHLHGEVAAHLVLQYLVEAFQREARPRLPDAVAFLPRTIIDAHQALVDYAAGKQLKETPRTTCVACIVQNGVAHWAHVGDSRLYHVRDGGVYTRTRDHSRVQTLIDAGRLSEEGAARHPERNKIFNCLGSDATPNVELSGHMPLRSGDTLLLCTDGLWGPLSNESITAALSQSDILTAMPALLDQAERRAGNQCDNLSAVAMTWAGRDALDKTITTQTLELNDFSTQADDFGKTLSGGGHDDLSDAEIESAIAEIRTAIRKHSPIRNS